MQLLAIKVLQALDLPLAQIQELMYGRSDQELEQLIETLPQPTEPVLPALSFREVVLEPGLRLVAEDGWAPRDEAALEQRIRAGIRALKGGGRT